jgi:hypothetical protein
LWRSDAPTTPKRCTPFTTKEIYKLITNTAPEIQIKIQTKIKDQSMQKGQITPTQGKLNMIQVNELRTPTKILPNGFFLCQALPSTFKRP